MKDADQIALERWITRRDAEAFSALVSRHAGMVYATSRRILRDAVEAEDVAQECFEALAQVNHRSHARSLGAWLHGMATKRSLQRLRTERRRRTREMRFSERSARNDAATWDDIYEHVDAAIAELPEKLRGPVVAHFLEGQSCASIAEHIGVSRQVVAYRLQSGVEHIRASLNRRGVLTSVGAIGSLLVTMPPEALPERLAATLGKLALSGVVRPVVGSAGAAMLPGILTLKNALLAAACLAAAAGAWIALAPGFRQSGAVSSAVAPVPANASRAIAPGASAPPAENAADGPLAGVSAVRGDANAARVEARGYLGAGAAPVDRPAVLEGAGKAPLKIELPDPSFSGTPLDYWSENFEISFKPRSPFYAPNDAHVVSGGKPVTSSDVTADPKKLTLVTDGDKSYEAKSLLTLKPGVQYIQINLQKPTPMYAIVVWHFHEYERVYHDVIVAVSNDPEFQRDVVTLFNNDCDNSAGLGEGDGKEYVEKAEGKLVDARCLTAQYVRLYSNGNCHDGSNTYVEVEVFGRP